MIGTVETAVFQRLTAQMAGTPIYLHTIPEEERDPCVVIEASLRVDSEGSAPIYLVELRTAAYDRVHSTNESLAATLKTALKDWMYGGAGIRLGPLELTNAEPGYEEMWDQFRMTLTWSGLAILWDV